MYGPAAAAAAAAGADGSGSGRLPDYLASHRRLIAWYKAPKICDLASVPGKKAFDQRFLTTQPAAAAPGLDVP